jgi:zinc transporter, ZIP family
MGGLGLMILLGATAGYGAIGAAPPPDGSDPRLGVSALLYLVTEELLVEAHDRPDTPLITATFFPDFPIPIVLVHL